MTRNPEWVRYARSISSWLEPPAIAAIRSELPDLAEEVVGAIQREVPGYSRPLSGAFGRGIRLGVEQALSQFVGEGEVAPEVYRSLGYGEWTAGRTLDSLQSAYRVGARVAWRRMSQAAAGTGATADAQRQLAEAMFAYIEHIAAESVEGYAGAQLAQAGDLERRRAALFAKLMSVPPLDAASVATAAAEARWTIPATIACLAVPSEAAAAMVRRLSGDTLHGLLGEWTCIVVPDPSRAEHEARAVAERLGVVATLGPSVAVAETHVSMRWASLAHELPASRPGLVVAERRLADIALRASPDIIAALAERVLAPLDGETANSRRRLEQTLHAWLRRLGSQRAVAEELGLHPQTIRYRLARLRELFGDALQDPDARFALEIALRQRGAPAGL
jgi:PucR C-terminal helix-turn-helix domain